ncbi:TIGR04290 family methyltransferase [soil metagenome]
MPDTRMGGTEATIRALGPWFHNLHLPDGIQTAPEHFLGDFPGFKWARVQDAVPRDLRGWRVLDIGCNAGFYSFELARRGAEVTAVDIDPHYLAQARWAARRLGLEPRVDIRQGHIYELAREREPYDLVWFTGVFYHLRHPLLALDIVRRLTARIMMFQTLTMPGDRVARVPEDLGLGDRDAMLDDGWPKLAFIEHRLAGDPTNWWAPNHACIEALLCSSGFGVIARPEHEFYLCEPLPDVASEVRNDLESLFGAAEP